MLTTRQLGRRLRTRRRRSIAWSISSVFVVQPDELALIRRCGRLLPTVREPGLHLGLPWGIDRVERISKRLYAFGYGDDCVTLDLSIAYGS